MRLSQLTARLIASFATDAVVAKITIDDCIRAISITREKRDWKESIEPHPLPPWHY